MQTDPSPQPSQISPSRFFAILGILASFVVPLFATAATMVAVVYLPAHADAQLPASCTDLSGGNPFAAPTCAADLSNSAGNCNTGSNSVNRLACFEALGGAAVDFVTETAGITITACVTTSPPAGCPNANVNPLSALGTVVGVVTTTVETVNNGVIRAAPALQPVATLVDDVVCLLDNLVAASVQTSCVVIPPLPSTSNGPTSYPITLSNLGSSTLTEGGVANFRVSRDTANSASAVAVNLAVTDGPLFTLSVPSVITLAAGATSQDFQATLLDDNFDAAGFTASVMAACATASCSSSSATLALVDNDVPAFAIVSGTEVTEGASIGFTVQRTGPVQPNANSPTFSIPFTFSLAGVPSRQVSAPTFTSIVAGGALTQSPQIVATIKQDLTASGDRLLQLSFTPAAGVASFPAGAVQTVTVHDDDTADAFISVVSGDQTVNNGETGIPVVLYRNGSLADPAYVAFTYSSTTASGFAAEGRDFAIHPAGAVTFAAGQAYTSVTLDTLGSTYTGVGLTLTLLRATESALPVPLVGTQWHLTIVQNLHQTSNPVSIAAGGLWTNQAGGPVTDAALVAAGDGLYAKTTFLNTPLALSLSPAAYAGLPSSAFVQTVSLVLTNWATGISSPTNLVYFEARAKVGTFYTPYQSFVAGVAGAPNMATLSFARPGAPAWSVADLAQATFEVVARAGNGAGVHTYVLDQVANLLSINAAPAVAAIDVPAVTEDTPSNIFHAALSDSDNDQAYLQFTALPQHGTLQVDGAAAALATSYRGDAELVYVPAAEFPYASSGTGADAFDYKAVDSQGTSSPTRTALVTVSAVNDLPVAADQGLATPVGMTESTALRLTLGATDVPDHDVLTISLGAAAFVTVQAPPATTGSVVATVTPDAGYYGPAFFQYQACDQGGCGNLATVILEVVPVNHPPTASVVDLSKATWDEDTATTLQFTVGDDKSGPTDIQVVGIGTDNPALLPGPFSAGGQDTTRSLILTPSADAYGTATVYVVIQDTAFQGQPAQKATLSIPVTVHNVEDAPALAAIAPLTVAEDSAVGVTFTAVATDVDHDVPLTITAGTPGHGAVSQATFTASNGRSTYSLVYTPNDPNYNGPDTFTVQATDGQRFATRTVSVSVTPVNDAPFLTGSTIAVTEDTSRAVAIPAFDVDGNTLTFTVVSGPTTGSALQLGGVTCAAGTCTLSATYTPARDFNGSDPVVLRASDGATSSTATFVFSVSAVNDAPVITGFTEQGPSQSATAAAGSGATYTTVRTYSEGQTVTLSGVASDVDRDALTHQWSFLTCTGQVDDCPDSFGGQATFSFTLPTILDNGTGSVLLQDAVGDGQGGFATATILVLFANVDQAPTVAATIPATANENSVVTLNALGSDPDQTTVTYLWSQVGGETVALSSATQSVVTFTAPAIDGNQPGQQKVLTFAVGVKDANNSVTTFTGAVRVLNVNQAPNAATLSGATSGYEGDVATLAAAVTDPDAGDALAYTWIVDGTTRSATGSSVTFTVPSAGATNTISPTIAVTMVATDPSGSSIQRAAAFTVLNRNEAPTFTVLLPDLATESTLVTLSIPSVTDGDNDQTFSYAWTVVSTSNLAASPTLTGASSPTLSFVAPQVLRNPSGTVVLRAQVADGFGGTTSTLVTMAIQNVNVAPTVDGLTVVSTPGNGVANERTAVNVQAGTVSDADQDTPITYEWTVSGPLAVTSISGQGTSLYHFVTPTQSSLTPSLYTVSLTLRDGVGGVSTTQTVLRVVDTDEFIAPSLSGVGTDPTTAASTGVTEGTAVTLTALVSFANPNGGARTYTASWAQVSGPTASIGSDVVDATSLTSGTFPADVQVVLPSVATNPGATLTFRLNVVDDQGLGVTSGLVTVVLRHANQPPTAVGTPSCGTTEDVATTCDFTTNFYDVDADTLTVASVTHSGTALGSATFNGLKLSYVPYANANGVDTVSFVVSDGYGGTLPATVAISIAAVDDPAVIVLPASLAGTEDTTLAFTVSASDVEDGALPLAVAATPGTGMLTYSQVTGTVWQVTFTPTPNFFGAVLMTFSADTTVVTRSVQFAGVNDPPTFTPGTLSYDLLEDAAAASEAWATGVSNGNAYETETVSLVFTQLSGPTGLFASGPAVAVSGSSGTLSYQLAADANGVAVYSVRAYDGLTYSPASTVTFSVTAVNDAPTFVKGPDISVAHGTTPFTQQTWIQGVTLGPADEQAAQSVLAYNLVATNGNLFSQAPAISPSGTLTFTGSGQTGQSLVSVRLQDNGGTANGGQDTSLSKIFRITFT